MSVEKAHVNMEIDPMLLLNFNIYCKVNKLTQSEALEKLIKEHIPKWNVDIKVK